jgi:hypothetical protein
VTGLCPKRSIGGCVIRDDYGSLPACAQAARDYRRQNGASAPFIEVDRSGVYRQRTP